MDYTEILNSIKEDLENEGLNCIIQSFNDLPSKLLIYTGEDKEKRMQLIEIRIPTLMLDQSLAAASTHDCLNVQLAAFFPFVVEDMALTDVAQFLHFLNFQVEVPGFYLNYIDKTIVYRYVLLSEIHHVSKKILLSLIGVAMLFQDVFSPILEPLAQGKVTFSDQMEEIHEILKKASKNKKSKQINTTG